jgi:hypothetical protein
MAVTPNNIEVSLVTLLSHTYKPGNQLQVRRVDTSNTQVTAAYRWES